MFLAICDDGKSEEVRQFELRCNLIRPSLFTVQIRHLAAVLLRRLLFSSFEELSNNDSGELIQQLKTHILQLMQKDNISSELRKKICSVTTELAKNFLGSVPWFCDVECRSNVCFLDDDGNNLWPELISFMFSSAESPNVELRECGLFLFK